jgi:hypothetical protein
MEFELMRNVQFIWGILIFFHSQLIDSPLSIVMSHLDWIRISFAVQWCAELDVTVKGERDGGSGHVISK